MKHFQISGLERPILPQGNRTAIPYLRLTPPISLISHNFFSRCHIIGIKTQFKIGVN